MVLLQNCIPLSNKRATSVQRFSQNETAQCGEYCNSLPTQIKIITFVTDKIAEIMKIAIINGPNLNLLGIREPSIYGNEGFENYLKELRELYGSVTEIHYFQSNHEGAIIDELHRTGFEYDAIVLNAGAYTHTSLAIADAISAIKAPVIEVHISNVHKREEFRHHSMISRVCKGVIAGFGLDGYRLAIEAAIRLKNQEEE